MSTTAPPSKLRLDLDTASTLVLPDGRTLAWDEYGDPTGEPIIYCPGFPSSRIEGAGLEPEASRVGARIISIDRPGYGLSSPHKGRSVLSNAYDIEAVTNHLKLKRYGVLGISGGGPYALACARVLPVDKLRAVSIVCGLGSPDMGYWGMNWMHWLGWTVGQRYLPGLCRWWFGRQPDARLDLSEHDRFELMRKEFERGKAKLNPKDLALFGNADWRWMRVRNSAEVYRNGTAGMSDDFRALNSDFGFKIEEIRKNLPVRLWHGRLDDFVPLQHAQKVKARIGDSARLEVSEDTHASVYVERKEEFLGELVNAIKA